MEGVPLFTDAVTWSDQTRLHPERAATAEAVDEDPAGQPTSSEGRPLTRSGTWRWTGVGRRVRPQQERKREAPPEINEAEDGWVRAPTDVNSTSGMTRTGLKLPLQHLSQPVPPIPPERTNQQHHTPTAEEDQADPTDDRSKA